MRALDELLLSVATQTRRWISVAIGLAGNDQAGHV